MLKKSFLLKIMDSANMRRWNDKICPVEMRELDKQAHKMVIAYVLGKFDEDKPDFDWMEIIEGGIFEFLQRLVLTDLKPQIFHKIKNDKEKYRELNQWVLEQLSPIMTPLGSDFLQRFQNYLTDDTETINRRILNAAHFHATKWEFQIIERSDPNGYEIDDIKASLKNQTRRYYNLTGVQQLALYEDYGKFIDLCGQLRFQIRWSHLHRIPRTSVLGHSFIVALLSYLLTLEIEGCSRRRFNNFFTGIFHDLPEVLTRDIINPVKTSVEGLGQLIKSFEKEEMEQKIYHAKMIPPSWEKELRLFTEDEFENVVYKDKIRISIPSEEISRNYNDNIFNPRDGKLVKASDELAAFLEAYLAIQNGSPSPEFTRAVDFLKNKYLGTQMADINLSAIYQDFD